VKKFITNEEYAQRVNEFSGVMFRLDLFPAGMLAEKMLEAQNDCEGLNIYRKALFYGQRNVGLAAARAIYKLAHPEWGGRNIMGTYADENGDEQILELSFKQQQILHAVLGVAAEAGKLINTFIQGMGAVQRSERVPSDAFDEADLLKQAGDIEWFVTILLNAINKSREECLTVNEARFEHEIRVADLDSVHEVKEGSKPMNSMLNWIITEHGAERGATLEHLGFIPQFVNAHDPRPAKDQIDEQYQHGGGWRNYTGFKLGDDNRLISQYAEDPDLLPIAEAKHDHEQLFFYDHAWTCIKQPDGSFEVARLD
jgi:hypothetical protein